MNGKVVVFVAILTVGSASAVTPECRTEASISQKIPNEMTEPRQCRARTPEAASIREEPSNEGFSGTWSSGICGGSASDC